MNASEGLKRIATVIRWIGLAIGLVMLAGFLWVASERDGREVAQVMFGVGGFAFFAGGSWAIGWIIDGFAVPRDKKRGDEPAAR